MFTRSAEGAAEDHKTAGSKIVAFLSRFVSMAAARRRERRLRICETLSFGEKRFIAVVEYDRQRFLLGGTPQNISLLQCLNGSDGKPDQGSSLESNPK
jgi:flagellar biogenesis protein FliO